MRYSVSCSCGSVQCEIDEPSGVFNCHCRECRKASGCAFVTLVVTSAEAARLVQGGEFLGEYPSSDWVTRYFCLGCGTPIFNTNSRLPRIRLFYLGAIDANEDLVPERNVFCRSRLAWVDRTRELESHDARPPAQEHET